MGHYLVQTAYTPAAVQALLKNPQDRLTVMRNVVERLGGSVDNAWLSLGEYDTVLICQLPDTVGATALSMAINAGGAVKTVKTTPLLTRQESLDAMRIAAEAGYRPPSA